MREKSNIECVAVVETEMNKRGGDGDCCFVVQGVTDTTDVTYVIVTRTRELGDLLAEREKGVKDKA